MEDSFKLPDRLIGVSLVTDPVSPLVDAPDVLGYRRVHLPGRSVKASVGVDARLWKCDPAHPHGPFGGCTWVPLGDHLPECGYVASRAQFSVNLYGPGAGPAATRYYDTLPAALTAAAARVTDWNRRVS